jgi:hypothetical protein
MKFPQDITKVCITLGRYAGPFVTEKYWQVITDAPCVAQVYFACMVRGVKVEMYEYLQNVAINVAASHEGVAIPVFRSFLANLKKGSFHCSSNRVQTPEEYMEEQALGQEAHGHPAPTSTAPTVVSSVASTRTGASSLTADTRVAPAARVANPAPDTAEFSSITVPRPGGTRPILREHCPPVNDAGSEFCLAWWLRCGCFENCGRRSTHIQGRRHAGQTHPFVKFLSEPRRRT